MEIIYLQKETKNDNKIDDDDKKFLIELTKKFPSFNFHECNYSDEENHSYSLDFIFKYNRNMNTNDDLSIIRDFVVEFNNRKTLGLNGELNYKDSHEYVMGIYTYTGYHYRIIFNAKIIEIENMQPYIKTYMIVKKYKLIEETIKELNIDTDLNGYIDW